MNDLKLQHRKEMDSFSDKMEATQREVKDLMQRLREKEQVRCVDSLVEWIHPCTCICHNIHIVLVYH